jgi:predicted aspartyl protease
METILNVPNELEYFEGLVKLAKKRKDEETQQVTHITTVFIVPTIKQISINRNHRGKTLHLTIEVHNGLIRRLVDTGAFMLVMATTIVRELGIMHLVLGNESYNTTSSTVTRALGRITDIFMKFGNV